MEEEENNEEMRYSNDYYINKEIEFFLSFELGEEENPIGYEYGKGSDEESDDTDKEGDS